MFRQFRQPLPWEYETEEEYQEALDAWDYEMQLREDYLVEKRLERQSA